MERRIDNMQTELYSKAKNGFSKSSITGRRIKVNGDVF